MTLSEDIFDMTTGLSLFDKLTISGLPDIIYTMQQKGCGLKMCTSLTSAEPCWLSSNLSAVDCCHDELQSGVVIQTSDWSFK